MPAINQLKSLEHTFDSAGLTSLLLDHNVQSAEALQYAVTNNKPAQDLARNAGSLRLLSRLLADASDEKAASSAIDTCTALVNNNRSSQDAAGSSGIIWSLLKVLNGDAQLKSERCLVGACTCLGVICVSHHSNQALARDAGCVELIVSLIGYSRLPMVRQRACFALGCLAADNPPMRSYTVSAGGVRAVLALLPTRISSVSHDASAQRDALQVLAAIRSLAIGHLEAQLDALSAGGYSLVAALLRAPPALAAAACETLAVLLKGTGRSQQQLRAGAALVDLTALLARFDSGGDGGSGGSGGIEVAGSCGGGGRGGGIDKSRDQLCAAACRALEMLVAGDAMCQDAVRTSGALASLLSLARATHRGAEVASSAISAVCACVAGNANNQEFVKQGGGVHTLIACARAELESICPSSAYATLAAMAFEDDDVRRAMAAKIGPGVRPWVHRLCKRLTPLPMGTSAAAFRTPHGQLSDTERSTREACSGLAAIVGCLAAHGEALSSPASSVGAGVSEHPDASRPLSAYELGPLAACVGMSGEVAQSAIVAMLQLLEGQGATIIDMLHALMQHRDGTGTADLVRMITASAAAMEPKGEAGDDAPPPTAQLSQAACALVASLAGCKGAPMALRAAGALPALLKVASAPDAASATASLTALAALTALMGSESASQDAARDANALPLLIHLIRSAADDMKLHALSALTAFVARNATNREAVRAANALPMIIALVHPKSGPSLADHATVALVHLAARSPDNQRDIEKHGGVIALAALAAHHDSRGQLALRDAAERALYECSFDNPLVDMAVSEARQAVRRGLVDFEVPAEWERFRLRARNSRMVVMNVSAHS